MSLRFTRCWFAVLVTWPMVAAVLGAPAAPEGLTMHRLQAGTPDADGWFSATSTLGRFSVRLPLPFNDFSVPAEQGSTQLCHAIGSKSKEGVKFSATRVPILKPRKSCDDFLERFPRDFQGKHMLSSERRLRAEGRDALECTLTNASGQAFLRVVCLKDGAMVMTVEFPLTLPPEEVQPAAQKFFDSARIDPGEPEVNPGRGAVPSPQSPGAAVPPPRR